MQQKSYEWTSFPVGPLGCNCSLVWDPTTREAILIDPGAEFKKIEKAASDHQLKIKAIVHTHAHFDHLGASKASREFFKAPLYLHPGDKPLWENVPMQGSFFGLPLESPGEYQNDLEHEFDLSFGNQKLRTLYTPGHTPGSCCFQIGEILFAGDTLFQGSVGRTDLWGGDFDQISKSIKERLYSLDDDTQVVCGHGPQTIIGKEKRSNPFVKV